MEDESSNRRFMLAAVLCLLVLMAWQTFFAPPPPNPAEISSGTKTSSTAVAEAVVSSTTSKTAPVARTPSSVKPTTKAEPKTFAFEGLVESDGTKIPYKITLSNVGGGIESFTLPGYKERNKDNEATEEAISLAKPTLGMSNPEVAAFAQMAGISFTDRTSFDVPERIVYEVVETSTEGLSSYDAMVRYRHITSDGIEIEREYWLRKDSFEIELAVTVRNGSEQNQEFGLGIHSALEVSEAMKKGSGFFSAFIPPPDHLHALCYTDGDVEREDYSGLSDAQMTFKEKVQWVAMDRQYFSSAILAHDGTGARCSLRGQEDLFQAGLIMPEVKLRKGAEKRHRFVAYLGVKKQDLLTRVGTNSKLEEVVDYKFIGLNLAPLCTFLLFILRAIFGVTGSWGLAILGLTFLVRVVLFPLNQRSGKSMRALAALRPKMEEIRTKYPDDRQRQSEEMMKLYRKHNVNPAGGCLPVLLQMPIWVALYRALFAAVDLYQQGFLWIVDLTTRDPYWILPVGLVVVMFLQQKMTPTTMDPAQQKMMQYTMPLVFGVMMSALPAGLCFYILVNTILTIVQQHFINKSIGPMPGPATAESAKT